jgi:hypothetical protein
VNVVLSVIVFMILDRGRLISPASSRATAARVARLRAVAVQRAKLTPAEAAD